MIMRSNENLHPGSIYQTKVDFDTLDRVTRMKPLSMTKSLDKVFRGRHISPSKETRFGMPSRLKADNDGEMGKLM
jgi:hypothetical protein